MAAVDVTQLLADLRQNRHGPEADPPAPAGTSTLRELRTGLPSQGVSERTHVLDGLTAGDVDEVAVSGQRDGLLCNGQLRRRVHDASLRAGA